VPTTAGEAKGEGKAVARRGQVQAGEVLARGVSSGVCVVLCVCAVLSRPRWWCWAGPASECRQPIIRMTAGEIGRRRLNVSERAMGFDTARQRLAGRERSRLAGRDERGAVRARLFVWVLELRPDCIDSSLSVVCFKLASSEHLLANMGA
jgi:hypothetical protein